MSFTPAGPHRAFRQKQVNELVMRNCSLSGDDYFVNVHIRTLNVYMRSND